MTPNPRLLTMLLAFIGGTLCASAARPLGTLPATVAGLFGAAAGWVASRWLMRKIF